jgi:hypothetical protein
MSGLLITSSFATTVLIPHQAFEEAARPAAGPWPTWPMSTGAAAWDRLCPEPLGILGFAGAAAAARGCWPSP